MINDYQLEAESLCERQNMRLLSAELAADESCCYIKAITPDQFGEVWRMRYAPEGWNTLNQRIVRFSLFSLNEKEPFIPLCVLDDVAQLHDYMQKTEGQHASERGHDS